MNMGVLPKVDDSSAITTEEVSEALGGLEISEQDNVSKVLSAVVKLEQLTTLIHMDSRTNSIFFRQ